MSRQGPPSVLDDLGEEITGIIAPVSICMALVVVLVKVLNPEGAADTTTVAIATIAYQEKDTDSAGQKLGGALLNAIIFMAVIAGMTFVLFLLFKWGCYRVIYGYMGFAMLNIFFFFTGALVLQLLRLIGLHVDLFSLAFLLYNFSVLGILSLFVLPVPLFVKQCYTVWVGICVAYIFTHIPEWTSWVLLVIMALYDLAAVLLPGGPLKILVELAIERQQELPALIYESRPVGRPYQRGMWRRQPGGDSNGSSGAAAAAGAGGNEPSGTPTAACVALLAGQRASSDDVSQEMAFAAVPSNMSSTSTGRAGAGAVPLAEGKESAVQQQQLAVLMRRAAARSAAAAVGTTAAAPLGEGVEDEAAAAAMLAIQGGSSMAASGDGTGSANQLAGRAAISTDSSSRQYNAEAAGYSASIPDAVGAAGLSLPGGDPAAATAAAPGSTSLAVQPYAGDVAAPGSTASGEDEMELPDGIKLGLGDFIFYSMLVGRAAMYDFMTVYASYIAVISGLGITLMLLALYRKALPALPVSIALGVVFYFLTRLVMEPFVVPLSLNLAYY